MLCCIGEFGSASGMRQRLGQRTGTSINSTINISYTGKLNFAIWLWKEQTINRTPEQPQKPQGRDCWAVWSCRWQLLLAHREGWQKYQLVQQGGKERVQQPKHPWLHPDKKSKHPSILTLQTQVHHAANVMWHLQHHCALNHWGTESQWAFCSYCL